MPTIFQRLRNAVQHGYNAFRDQDPNSIYSSNLGSSYSTRPDRMRLRMGTERSIISSVYTRIGIDVAAILIQHVKLDQNGRFIQIVDSGLNNCLTVESNIDQTGRAFIQDVAMSMLDEGAVGIVAVDTTLNPSISNSWDVTTMRTAKIVEWYPYHVKLNLWNEKHGQKEDIILPKKDVVIIENPLYQIMNEPNSTLKRLIRKLNLLDVIDDQSGSGKLDILIQVPYTVKTDARKKQAAERRKEIEEQLTGSKYGIGYIDATEKVTQLNRPAENNLMTQIEFLTSTLYSQLGLALAIFDGTADETVMLNYHARTIEPILNAITDGMTRTFLTKTARTQGQAIVYFRDPFKLVPATALGSIADNFTRNAILTSNEFRQVIGYKPSDDPEADTLRNKNLNPPTGQPNASLMPVNKEPPM